MNIQQYLQKYKNIQDSTLTYLEKEANTEENYHYLNDIIDKYQIFNNKYEFSLFLHLISKISNNYHRNPNFIAKIEKILENLNNEIKNNFSNYEIFNIFKCNKRILLFLFDQKVIKIDNFIVKNIVTKNFIKAKYPQYFSPEIKPFINEEWFPKYEESHSKYLPSKNEWVQEIEKELPDNFYELRKEGENESYVCKLIRDDSIKEFIQYVNKNNFSLQSIVELSIYETNSFLIKKQNGLNFETKSFEKSKIRYCPFFDKPIYKNEVTLIKYAAFYGSFQIFKYLQLNKVDLASDIMQFAIHGKNAEIIHFLESDCIVNIDKDERKLEINECIEESIKCHHNDITNYLLDNYSQYKKKKSKKILLPSLKSYNFAFILDEKIDKKSFFYLCQYDYCSLLNILLNTNKINVNEIQIQIIK